VDKPVNKMRIDCEKNGIKITGKKLLTLLSTDFPKLSSPPMIKKDYKIKVK